MDRLEAIEHLIEIDREEVPRIVAERSRDAVKAMEAGVASVMASTRDRLRPELLRPELLRPEPRRSRAVRLLAIALVVAAASAIAGLVLARLVERGRGWQRRRQAGRGPELTIAQAERTSEVLDRPEDLATSRPAQPQRVVIPVSPPSTDGTPAVSADLGSLAAS